MEKAHKEKSRYSKSSSTESDNEERGRVRSWSERQTSYSISRRGNPRKYEETKHEVCSSHADKSSSSSSREIGRSASPRESHSYSSKESSCSSKERRFNSPREKMRYSSSSDKKHSPSLREKSCSSREKRHSSSSRDTKHAVSSRCKRRSSSISDRDIPVRHSKEKKCRKRSSSFRKNRKTNSPFKRNRRSSSSEHRSIPRKDNNKQVVIHSSSSSSFNRDNSDKDWTTRDKNKYLTSSDSDDAEKRSKNSVQHRISSSYKIENQDKDGQKIRSKRNSFSAKDKTEKRSSSLSDRDSTNKEMQFQDNMPSSFAERRHSSSFSARDSERKDKRQSRDKHSSSFSRRQEYSISLRDNVRSVRSRNRESPIKDYKTRDKRYSSLVSRSSSTIKDNTPVKEMECCFSASIEDSPGKYSMKIQRTVKRKRSSSSSSTDSVTATNETVDRLSPKRRVHKYKRSCRRSSKSPTDEQFENKIQNVATVHFTSIKNIHGDRQPTASKSKTIFKAAEPQRSPRGAFQQQNFSTCCSEQDSRHVELSSGRRRFEGEELKQSPVMYGRKESFRPLSDCSSPKFLTPVSQRKGRWQGSPQFTSPSFISSASPRSALRGLDQPHPWARDLVSRSVNLPSFIDSHCHIDLLYDRLGVSHSTKFCDFRKMVNCSFPANFDGCVAVFCYPKTYDPRNPQNELFYTLAEDENIWFALGCHPKSATDFMARHEDGLRKALSHPKVVALGEIGLDYSGSFYHHAETQKAVLRKQIQMALDLKLPLVIHCRDAYDDCLAILKEMLPRLWRIHLHCFCGNMEIAKIWLETFPNLFIGLTPVITYKSAHDSMDAARNIPLDRILLETDSPYFVPGNIREGRVQVSHPGFALFTAERIAELRNIPVNTILQVCRTNTRLMYGI